MGVGYQYSFVVLARVCNFYGSEFKSILESLILWLKVFISKRSLKSNKKWQK